MFHTVHRASVKGVSSPQELQRSSDRLVEELHRRGFFAGIGSSQLLVALADCSQAAADVDPAAGLEG
jgi:hypothetical protein